MDVLGWIVVVMLITLSLGWLFFGDKIVRSLGIATGDSWIIPSTKK